MLVVLDGGGYRPIWGGGAKGIQSMHAGLEFSSRMMAIVASCISAEKLTGKMHLRRCAIGCQEVNWSCRLLVQLR